MAKRFTAANNIHEDVVEVWGEQGCLAAKPEHFFLQRYEKRIAQNGSTLWMCYLAERSLNAVVMMVSKHYCSRIKRWNHCTQDVKLHCKSSLAFANQVG